METILSSNEVQRKKLIPTKGAKVRTVDLALYLAIGMTVLVYFLISLGGLVRNEGAGLSCPDWPLCFGKVVPPMNYQVFLEWFHRLIAGSVSVSFLILGALLFSQKELRARYSLHLLASLGLLMSQVVLGGLTVLGLLNPKWVSSHLLFGLAFFSSLVLLVLRLKDHDQKISMAKKQNQTLFKVSGIVTAVLFFQIFLGGLVSSNYAGLACGGFPKCLGEWIPPFQGLVGYHMLHRLGALVTTFVILAFAFYMRNQMPDLSLRSQKAIRWLPILLGAQLSLGTGAVLWSLPLLVSVSHLAVAVAMLGTLMVLNYEARRA